VKNILKRVIRDEKGQAMFLTVILLLVGGLIVSSLLAYMGNGLLNGRVYERRTAELYAADAGVEDAVWKIQHGEVAACAAQPIEPPYNISVNGKNVTVYIEYDLNTGMYIITSTAITDDGGNTAAIDSSTAVEAYVTAAYIDFSSLLDNAITSNDDVRIQPGSTVSGNISLPPDGDLWPSDFDPANGEVNREELIWPTAQDMIDFYWPDVENLDPYPDGYVINVPSGTSEDDPYVIGPLSAAGSLTIKGTGWVKIGGTIYVKNDLNFNVNPTMNVNLNQQTIFAEGDIYIPPKVTISGSGCIIAAGDVDFNPNISTTGEDFLLVMSVEGTIDLKPLSSFYGAIVGNVDVTLQPNISLTWLSPEGKGLNFPTDDPINKSKWIWKIDTWEVSQQ